MAQANHKPTAPAAEAHPAPPPVVEGDRTDEPVESRRPWSIADEVLTGVRQIQDFAQVIAAAGSAGNTDDGSAIAAVAWDIVDRADRACELQNALLAKLSSANKEGPAPAAHPVPSDADLVNLACNRLNSLDDDMDAIGDFCNVIIVGLALEVERDHPALGGAIHRIAREIESRHEAIAEVCSELLHALRRVPAAAIRNVLKDVEVEEAAGDA